MSFSTHGETKLKLKFLSPKEQNRPLMTAPFKALNEGWMWPTGGGND